MTIAKDKQDAIDNINHLYACAKEKPDAICTLYGHDYYNIAPVIEALEDMKLRATLGGQTKADSLLMTILSYNMHCVS